MIRFVFIAIAISIPLECILSQNLIFNASFEIADTCPYSPNQVYLANGWDTIRTPDLFSKCTLNGISWTAGDTVHTVIGSQVPQDGNNFVGLYTSSYLENSLSEMIIGKLNF